MDLIHTLVFGAAQVVGSLTFILTLAILYTVVPLAIVMFTYDRAVVPVYNATVSLLKG